MAERLEKIAQSLSSTADTVHERQYDRDQDKLEPESIVERDANYLRVLAEGVILAREISPNACSFAVLLPSGYSKVVDIRETNSDVVQNLQQNPRGWVRGVFTKLEEFNDWLVRRTADDWKYW